MLGVTGLLAAGASESNQSQGSSRAPISGGSTGGKGLVQEGGGKHLLGLPGKEKQVTLLSKDKGTHHPACLQTLILEALLELLREAGKMQAGWVWGR